MTLLEFKKLNKSIGNHWFDNGAMEFFNSAIEHWDADTGLFITSDKMGDRERKFSIRRANFETGRVKTVGEFQEYDTLAEAKKSLKQISLTL